MKLSILSIKQITLFLIFLIFLTNIIEIKSIKLNRKRSTKRGENKATNFPNRSNNRKNRFWGIAAAIGYELYDLAKSIKIKSKPSDNNKEIEENDERKKRLSQIKRKLLRIIEKQEH